MRAALSVDRMHPGQETKYRRFRVQSPCQTGLVLQMDTWIVVSMSFSSAELDDKGPCLRFSGHMFELKNRKLDLCCSDLSLLWGKFPSGSN